MSHCQWAIRSIVYCCSHMHIEYQILFPFSLFMMACRPYAHDALITAIPVTICLRPPKHSLVPIVIFPTDLYHMRYLHTDAAIQVHCYTRCALPTKHWPKGFIQPMCNDSLPTHKLQRGSVSGHRGPLMIRTANSIGMQQSYTQLEIGKFPHTLR